MCLTSAPCCPQGRGTKATAAALTSCHLDLHGSSHCSFPGFIRVASNAQTRPDTGKRRQLREGRRGAHLHVAHSILKEHQVHHCVDFIVVLQGFHQSLGQKFPQLYWQVLGLASAICKMAIHVLASCLLHSPFHTLEKRHKHKHPSY